MNVHKRRLQQRYLVSVANIYVGGSRGVNEWIQTGFGGVSVDVEGRHYIPVHKYYDIFIDNLL